MRAKAKKVLILTLGIMFVILGLLGLVLPVLQGVLFLAIGFILLSLCFPVIRLHITKHTERHPRLSSVIHKAEAWIKKFVGEV